MLWPWLSVSGCLSRVFIARTLPEYLAHVSPAEAVEYVLPLLNGLGTDQGMLSILHFCYVLLLFEFVAAMLTIDRR